MTTEWAPKLTIESCEKRVDERVAWSKCNFVFFVRKLLLENLAAELTEEARTKLAELSPADLLRCSLRDDLDLDDVAIADWSHLFAKGLRVSLASFPLTAFTTVDSVLEHVFDMLQYRTKLNVVVQDEIDMLKRGEEMRRRTLSFEGGASFTISTYNVNYAFARKANCASAQKVVDNVKRAAKSVDVLLFQETHDGFTALFDQVLSKSHPYRLLQNSSEDAGGAAVYSRLPIDHVLTIRPKVKGSTFPAQVYRLQVGGDQTVWILNVHLRPPMELTGGSGPFSMLATSDIRRAEVFEMIETMGLVGKKIVIAGDWNENDGMHALSYCVLKLNFEDALGLTDKFTHWWRFAKIADRKMEYVVHKRLDHILASPGLRVESCDVIDEMLDGSDHFLVHATIRLANKK